VFAVEHLNAWPSAPALAALVAEQQGPKQAGRQQQQQLDEEQELQEETVLF